MPRSDRPDAGIRLGLEIFFTIALGVGLCWVLFYMWFFTSTNVLAEPWRLNVLVVGCLVLGVGTFAMRARPIWWVLTGFAAVACCGVLIGAAWPLRNEYDNEWFTSPGDVNFILLPWIQLVFYAGTRRIRSGKTDAGPAPGMEDAF